MAVPVQWNVEYIHATDSLQGYFQGFRDKSPLAGNVANRRSRRRQKTPVSRVTA
ncbi:MAG TPA: hypothetical protein VNZ25_07885 [Candidatus Angelobacter sp.]|nr:hypothetical protein [Candidatus Angelobacter sp.]